MIDHLRELVFLHVPKCAGVSVELALGGIQPEVAHEQHWSSATIRRYYPEEWRDFHHFAVVRHPAARARSFLRFLRGYDPIWRRHLRPEASDTALLLDLVCSEGLFTAATPSRMLDGREEILRFEHLTDDWSAFADRHGLPRELGHRNRTSPTTGTDDPWLDHIVHAAFPDDYAPYGYTPPATPEGDLPLPARGTLAWVRLHAWARRLPDELDDAQRSEALAALGRWEEALPSDEWRERWASAIERQAPDLEHGRRARRWVSTVRDVVNRDLGKPTWDAWLA